MQWLVPAPQLLVLITREAGMTTFVPFSHQLAATCSAGKHSHSAPCSNLFRRRQVAISTVRALVQAQAKAKSGKQGSAKTKRRTKKQAAKPKPAPAPAPSTSTLEPEIMDIQGQVVDTRVPVTVGLSLLAVHRSVCPGVCSIDTNVDLCRLSPAFLDLERQLY